MTEAITEPATNATTADPPAGFTEHVATIDGRTMRYLEAGESRDDDAVLLVLHGGGGLDRGITAVHEQLAQRYRVIAPELPGFGASSREGLDSMADLAHVISAFASELGIERCAVLGTSVGAVTALWLAIERGDLVGKLILEAPALFRDPTAKPPTAPNGRGPDPAQFAFLQAVLGAEPEAQLMPHWPTLEIQTLVLLGADDPMFPATHIAEYSTLPAATVALVYDAGHDIKGQRPEAYLSAVSDYLDRGQAFVVSRASTVIHA